MISIFKTLSRYICLYLSSIILSSLQITYHLQDERYILEIRIFFSSSKMVLKAYENWAIASTWIWSLSKYCLTLEIIFVHYNKEFENFFQEFVSSLLSTHYRIFLFKGPFDSKLQSLKSRSKSNLRPLNIIKPWCHGRI